MKPSSILQGTVLFLIISMVMLIFAALGQILGDKVFSIVILTILSLIIFGALLYVCMLIFEDKGE